MCSLSTLCLSLCLSVCVCVYDTGHRVSTMERDEFHMNGSPPRLPLSVFSHSIHPFSLSSSVLTLYVSCSVLPFFSTLTVEIFGPYPTHPFIPSAHLTFYFLHRFLSVSTSQLLCP